MADMPGVEKSERSADEVVRNEDRDARNAEPQQPEPEQVEQELEDTDRFQATDN